VGNDSKTLREFVDGDPDSQESKIVKVRSSLLSDISEDRMRLRVNPRIEETINLSPITA
jgi:hypothetical protein